VPDILCSSCKKKSFVWEDNRKLLDSSGDFVCSLPCLLTWIRGSQVNPRFRTWENHAHKLAIETPVQFRSEYEERVARWLSGQGISWHFERWGFYVGEKKAYIPDFYLFEHGVFLEVKGRWGVGQKTKMAEFRKQYPEVPLLVVPWTLSEKFYGADLFQLR
jgi:hypothetical protein